MRLDRTHFTRGTHADLAEATKQYHHGLSISERLKIGVYLTRVAYGLEGKPWPKMEKQLFSVRKHER